MRRILLAVVLAAAVGTLINPAFGVSAKRKTVSARKPPKRKSARAKSRPELIAQITNEIRDSDAGVENASALVPFFERLYRKQPVSILQYGDSHTAADIWTGELRRLFQEKFGNGGAGFSHAGRPWNTYRRDDVRSGASKRWYTDGLVGRSGDGLYGLAGVSIEAERPNESVSLQADGPVLQVWYLRRPGGGSLELTDAGQVIDTIPTAGADTAPGYYDRDVAPGPHEYRLRTTERAPVRLFGWVTGNREGITYEMLGINGAQASMMLGWDTKLLSEHIQRRNPGLIVLAYGTNEAGNSKLTEDDYVDVLRRVVQRFRDAAPDASILLIGPPDRAARQRRQWRAYDHVDRIVSAERTASIEARCAFYDLRGKMGGKGVMHRWVTAGLAQADHVHLTATGYKLIAQALHSDVMKHYDRFVQAREQAAPGSGQ